MSRLISVAVAWALLATELPARAGAPEDPPMPVRTLLTQALEQSDARADAAARRHILEKAVREARPLLAGNVVLSRGLRQAQERAAAADDAPAADLLKAALREAAETLAFRPVIEAKLPEGFPAPTPVGEIQVKSYPRYRLARAGTQGDSAFWTLFNHIKKNDVAMTAPVEMTYGEGAKKARPEAMAFLYESVRQGDVGRQGAVDVADAPPMTVVSLGLRGDMSDARVAEARELLEGWLREHSREYVEAGPLRVMGYNSPFVPRQRRYFEVQVPVRKP